MNKLRFVLALVFVSVLLLTTVSIVSGGQEKVAVCHITGTHDFGEGEVDIGHVITIADPAYQAHLDHGDPEVWEIVELPDGSEVCRPGLPPKRVFVTSLTYTGALGGLAGADAICCGLALDAGLGGIYKAWLSTDAVSAADRLKHSTAPYVLVDGTRVADDWDGLTSPPLLAPINVDEKGNHVNHTHLELVWTGTDVDGGAVPGYTCIDWKSEYPGVEALIGQPGCTGIGWTEAQVSSCRRLENRIFCFEQ